MLKKRTLKSISLYLASFLLPFVIILLALNALHVTPFGDKTLVISDAKALYINYLGYANRLFKGLEGFTYSFEKGIGGNMLSHMTGTMINPFFPIFLFFDVVDYASAYTWVSVLNFCGCGFTMYMLLANEFGPRRSNLIFSTSYALSGFLVANVFQVIFFTGPLMLPLMVLGVKKIITGKNPFIYFFSLSFCILTNTYFGYTLCILSLILFFAYLWLMKEEMVGKRMALFVHYSIVSICSGLIPIVVWLPALMGIKGGRLDQTGIKDFSFWENMPFIEIFTKLFTGANTTSQLVDGLPNIYVGLLPIVLVILFFMNRNIAKRNKLAVGFILSFYLLGFYIIALDMFLHAGTTPNWFNHRYSYIFSFLLIMIAAYEWKYLDKVSYCDLKYCFIGLFLAIVLIFSKRYEYIMGGEVVLDIALLIVIFLAYRLYQKNPQKNPKSTFELVTIIVVSFFFFFNYVISTNNIMDWGIKETEYQNVVKSVSPLVDRIQMGDHDFYRMEVNKQRSGNAGNDPMLYGYNGVGHGGSNERDFVRTELNKLGVQWFDMRSFYAQGIPAATDALLGLRYLIADENVAEEKNYIRMTDMENMRLSSDGEVYDAYKSTCALPIAFVSEKYVNDLELTNADLFENLNCVWRGISGSDQCVFTEENDISFRTINLTDTKEMSAQEAREIVEEYDSESNNNNNDAVIDIEEGRNDVDAVTNNKLGSASNNSSSSEDKLAVHNIMDRVPEFSSCVEFGFIASQDGPVYVYHRAALSTVNGSYDPIVKYMGYYHKGDTVKGYLYVSDDYVNRITYEEFAGRFRAAYAELDALQELSDIVKTRPSTIEKVKDSHLKGTVTVEEGQELLFTIPWDTGWTCYIDGQPINLTKVLGVFMAAEITPGEHTFEMKYKPDGMDLGIKISLAATVVMIAYLAFGRRLIDRLLIKEVVSEEVVPEEAGQKATDKKDGSDEKLDKSEEPEELDAVSCEKDEVDTNDSV